MTVRSGLLLAIVIDSTTSSFSTIRGLGWLTRADEPLIEVFTPSNAHHLLLKTEIGLCQHGLKLAFAACMTKLILMSSLCIANFCRGGSSIGVVCSAQRVFLQSRGVILVLIYQDSSVLRRAWALTTSVEQRVWRWLLPLPILTIHLLQLLLDLFLLGETQWSGPPLKRELEGRLLHLLWWIIIARLPRLIIWLEVRRGQWRWGSSFTNKDAS